MTPLKVQFTFSDLEHAFKIDFWYINDIVIKKKLVYNIPLLGLSNFLETASHAEKNKTSNYDHKEKTL